MKNLFAFVLLLAANAALASPTIHDFAGNYEPVQGSEKICGLMLQITNPGLFIADVGLNTVVNENDTEGLSFNMNYPIRYVDGLRVTATIADSTLTVKTDQERWFGAKAVAKVIVTLSDDQKQIHVERFDRKISGKKLKKPASACDYVLVYKL